MQWDVLKNGIFKWKFLVESPMKDIWTTDDSMTVLKFLYNPLMEFHVTLEISTQCLSSGLSYSRSMNVLLLIHTILENQESIQYPQRSLYFYIGSSFPTLP